MTAPRLLDESRELLRGAWDDLGQARASLVEDVPAIDPVTICLVGCGKDKLEERAQAKDLYIGPLFRAARRYAESCDGWFVISAKHGLLDPEAFVEPYELRLPRGLVAQDDWGVRVASQLHQAMQDEEGLIQYQVVILAGADYACPVATHLRRLRVPVTMPLHSLGVGQRLAWLKRETKAVA